MKKLLALVALCVATSAFAGGEAKQVCTDVKDPKGNVVKKADGSPKQTCKTIKVHKKVEGDAVPDKKK
jgi:hypothetical protein